MRIYVATDLAGAIQETALSSELAKRRPLKYDQCSTMYKQNRCSVKQATVQTADRVIIAFARNTQPGPSVPSMILQYISFVHHQIVFSCVLASIMVRMCLATR